MCFLILQFTIPLLTWQAIKKVSMWMKNNCIVFLYNFMLKGVNINMLVSEFRTVKWITLVVELTDGTERTDILLHRESVRRYLFLKPMSIQPSTKPSLKLLFFKFFWIIVLTYFYYKIKIKKIKSEVCENTFKCVKISNIIYFKIE